MKNQEEIRDIFQEWFVDCTTYTEAAILYGKMYCELQRCLEESIRCLEAGEDGNE